MPDPLVMASGERVTGPDRWTQGRRPEILEFYRDQIYGRVPANAPRVSWEVSPADPGDREGSAVVKRAVGKMGEKPDGPRMNLTIHLPAKASGPVPVLLSITFGFGPRGQVLAKGAEAKEKAAPKGRPPGGFDVVGECLARGWGHASLNYAEIQPDRADRWAEGVIGLTLKEGQARPGPEEWGTISAWAWGISRAIDYLESDRAVNSKEIAITGASRLGKTVLWAAAQDERVAAVFSVVPGEMGAALIRRDWVETLDDMAQAREKFGLSSQQAQLAIKAVSDAYKRDKAIRVAFRPHAAIAHDQRTMRFKGIDKVSLLTLGGRIVVPFILGKYQSDRIGNAKGQCDLVLREDGKWFLIVTVDVPEGSPIPVTDFIGVDLGIANIATDSDGNAHSGKPVDDVRRKHNLQRKRLGRRNTKGSKKKLKRVAGKEARFRKETNHVISKRIVESARGTNRGIGLEDLTNIRARITASGGEARNRLGGWAFGQLGAFIDYKTRLGGVPVVYIDPRDTSRTCSECDHCERANRKTQGEFSCKACGMSMNADRNAALNIKVKALASFEQATGLVSPRA